MTIPTRRVALALWLTGCAGTAGVPLPTASQARLVDAGHDPTALGELVYDGRVQRRSDPGDTLFRYERRVAELDGALVSTHLTFTPDDEPVLLHQAVTSSDYELRSFDEIHGQTGLVAHLEVEPDGSADFQTTLGDRTVQRSEGPGAPVHVGPSLFGFALRHWDALLNGETRHLRFAVMDQQRTYRFALTLESTDETTTVFVMTATSAVVRLAVVPMRITFATDGRAVQRFEGLVPPRTGSPEALQPLEARVDYTQASDAYR